MCIDMFLALRRKIHIIETEEAKWPVQNSVPEQVRIHALKQDRLVRIALVCTRDAFHQVADAYCDVMIPLTRNDYFRHYHQGVNGNQCDRRGALRRSCA